jgi:SRSO17 transposase
MGDRDEAYGQDSKFRLRLQQRRIGYVLAVPRSQKIPTEGGIARADTLAALAPNAAWKRRSAGDKVKGPRLYDWAVASLPDTGTADHGFTRWLLIRRSITNPSELAYLCYGPTDTPHEQLIRVTGTRWAIEECFQTAKNEVGLDQYQVRRYDAWYRHITPGDGGARLPRYHRRERGKRHPNPERDGLIALTLGQGYDVC